MSALVFAFLMYSFAQIISAVGLY